MKYGRLLKPCSLTPRTIRNGRLQEICSFEILGRKHHDHRSENISSQAAGSREEGRRIISVIMKDSLTSSIPIEGDETIIEGNTSEADGLQTNPSGKGSHASDNESIASVASELSEMEPFPQYLPKIERLLSDIGLFGFSVEVLQHGYSFQNCVYALKSSRDDKEQYVLRIPVCSDLWETDEKCVAIENDVTILAFLIDKLPVPRVKAYSTTKENALNAPFTVQTRLPGRSLDQIYGELDHKDKLEIADRFVELLARLESVTFATAGTLTTSSPLPAAMSDSFPTAAPLVAIFDEGDADFLNEPKVSKDRAGPDVKSFLVSHLYGWIQKEIKDEGQQESLTLPSLRQLLVIIDEMDLQKAFRDGPYPVVLHHWDLEARNIMIEKSNGTWRICGVIDWDDALALPRPLARRPPAWIWDFDPEGFTGYLDNDHHPNDHLSDENLALKSHFDAKAAAALPSYIEDAYGRGRWLRRIWTFARSGADNMWYIDLIKQLPKDWAARPRPTVPQPEKPEGHWKKSLRWISQLAQTSRL